MDPHGPTEFVHSEFYQGGQRVVFSELSQGGNMLMKVMSLHQSEGCTVVWLIEQVVPSEENIAYMMLELNLL